MRHLVNFMAVVGTMLVLVIATWTITGFHNGDIKLRYVKPIGYTVDHEVIVKGFDGIQYYTLNDVLDHHKIIKMQGFKFYGFSDSRMI